MRERSLFTLGVGRILAVFFVIFARNCFLWPELGLLGRVGEMASPGSEASALVAGNAHEISCPLVLHPYHTEYIDSNSLQNISDMNRQCAICQKTTREKNDMLQGLENKKLKNENNLFHTILV